MEGGREGCVRVQSHIFFMNVSVSVQVLYVKHAPPQGPVCAVQYI